MYSPGVVELRLIRRFLAATMSSAASTHTTELSVFLKMSYFRFIDTPTRRNVRGRRRLMRCRLLCQGHNELQCSATSWSMTRSSLLPSPFSQLSFELRSAVRLPKGLRGVPHHQHDTEAYDRTDHSEHKAIICMWGIHICIRSSSAPDLAQRLDQTTD